MVIGALVGIALGIALAFLFDVFDRRVKSADELERSYGLPTLATIPYQRHSPSTEREQRIELEPFRILRDGLPYVSLRHPVRTVVVTSAVPEEGKTRVAAGLARAAASSGTRVALVEGDLYRPAVARELGIARGGRGLTNALVDPEGVKDLVAPMDGNPSLSVLLSGPLTPNSSELLRSHTMAAVLEELVAAYDIVIVDTPPLLSVADAHVMLEQPQVDVCLVVSRPNAVTREQIGGALTIIKRHPRIGIGMVINGVRGGTGGPYDYSLAGAGASASGSDDSDTVRQDRERVGG
jgi:capsular exopolysaccharide synthesis family protein